MLHEAVARYAEGSRSGAAAVQAEALAWSVLCRFGALSGSSWSAAGQCELAGAAGLAAEVAERPGSVFREDSD